MVKPIELRSHEVSDYKRCRRKWFWKWRQGLTPKATRFSALEFGTWMHTALEAWYQRGYERNGKLADHFREAADIALGNAYAADAPEHVIEKAEELAGLGEVMADAYQKHYDDDPNVYVLGTEVALDFTITDDEGAPIATDHLKPDMVYRDRQARNWLMENKTAAVIRTEHLVIDGQARPYGALAERALIKVGVLKPGETLSGIMYNFMRKAIPDARPVNELGQALNKNGTVSAKQQPPLFVRKPILLSRKAKLITLQRLRRDAIEIQTVTDLLKQKRLHPPYLSKTPHSSCAKFCDYFPICVVEEEGSDIRPMVQDLYRIEDPYTYGETTTESTSFEMG